VVRRGKRATIEIEGGVTWEMLTPSPSNNFEFLELVYEPGAQSNPTRYRHPGSEMVLMLEGTLQIELGFETYELTVGDSIFFPSTTPHRYVNTTDAVARAVTVILHDPQAESAAAAPATAD
jgi:quercetin dioxygenase-like cupin family protein